MANISKTAAAFNEAVKSLPAPKIDEFEKLSTTITTTKKPLAVIVEKLKGMPPADKFVKNIK